jgi:hypothetical protein
MDWIKYSGIWVTLICNPFHWQFSYVANETETEWPAPNRKTYILQILMLSVRIVIDNGDW